LIPVATWDERADLEASVRQFGYLSPLVVWRSEHGEVVILDGHARWELWRAAVANPDNNAGLAAREPSVIELALADRDAARLWIINNQLGRRNIATLDRIALVAEREKIIRRIAKANQSAAGQQSMFGRLFGAKLLTKSSKAEEPINTRKQSAAEAGVAEMTYADGKIVLDAVSKGELSPTIVEDIRAGEASISGVAKALKGKSGDKPTRKPKPKASGWQTIFRGFTAAVRRLIKRDPQRRAEIAAELRRLADEFEAGERAAA
jgi:ParB-like chromosome segregation protein Spo0J